MLSDPHFCPARLTFGDLIGRANSMDHPFVKEPANRSCFPHALMPRNIVSDGKFEGFGRFVAADSTGWLKSPNLV
ncbi:hypothetical protein [Thalassospira lucentensis]|uniref:hypothetical protein n=1 Tax=Thalassospira lucentensis TaxID=168935 RepID=UPI003D28A1A6